MQRYLNSYRQLCTQFYDLDKPAAPLDALDFYWRCYEAIGGPILEAMCGSGRFLIPFAQRGADIDGVDASPEMLGACRRKAEALGLSPPLYLQFLEELELPRKYRFIFVPAASFVLIPAAQQQDALSRLAAHLESDGELVVEMLRPGTNIDGVDGPVPERRVSRPDGAEIRLTVDADGVHRYELIRNGGGIETELETYPWAPRERAEFVTMLEAAGLKTERCLGGYSSAEASETDRLIIYVCRRL